MRTDESISPYFPYNFIGEIGYTNGDHVLIGLPNQYRKRFSVLLTADASGFNITTKPYYYTRTTTGSVFDYINSRLRVTPMIRAFADARCDFVTAI